MSCKYCKNGNYLIDFANNVVDIDMGKLSLRKFVDETLEYEEVDYINIKYCPMCGKPLEVKKDKKINYEEFGFRKGFDPENRFIVQEEIFYKGKHLYVSTVDLGLDHSFMSDIPLYYETMIFEQPSRVDVYQKRYTTEEEAREGHKEVIEAIYNGNLEKLECYY